MDAMGVGLGGLGEIIDSLTVVEDRVGNFIANGPGDGIQGYVRDAYRHRCREFANLPAWARALTGGAGGSVSRICSPYWADNGWDGPVNPGPDFTGGQCPIFYDISGNVATLDGGCNTTNNPLDVRGIRGPISNVSYDNSGSVGGAPPTCPNARGTAAFVTDGLGNKITLAGSGGGVLSASISVTPSGGGPDDCGDPPDAPLIPGPNPPPNPGPLPGPEPTDDPGAPGTPRIPIPPYEDPTYGPIPIEPPSGGGGGGGVGTPAPSPELGDPISFDPGVAPGDVDFGDPPEGRVWAGAFLRLNGEFAPFGVVPDSAPGNAALARVVANASLVFEPELPSTARGTATQVRSEWSAHIAEILGLPVSGLRVNINPSLGFTVFPVSVIDPEGLGDSEDG